MNKLDVFKSCLNSSHCPNTCTIENWKVVTLFEYLNAHNSLCTLFLPIFCKMPSTTVMKTLYNSLEIILEKENIELSSDETLSP